MKLKGGKREFPQGKAEKVKPFYLFPNSRNQRRDNSNLIISHYQILFKGIKIIYQLILAKSIATVSIHLRRVSENIGDKPLSDIRMNDVELF